jgi:hypothetical protein
MDWSARSAGPTQTEEEADVIDVYVGDSFEQSVKAQVEFLGSL